MSPDALAVPRRAVPNYGIDADRILARDSLGEAIRRRIDGRYAVDEFGGDPHLQDLLLVPLVDGLPVRVVGGERLPRSGPALLVVNRSPELAEPLVLAGAVQREVGRRLRMVGLPRPPLLGTLTRKLGGISRRPGDVAAVLRAGHLAAVPLAISWWGVGAGEAPRAVIAATLGFPLLPVALRPGGPGPLALRPWTVSVGEPLAPPEGTEPGDPLAAAELGEQVRAAVAGLLRDPSGPVGSG